MELSVQHQCKNETKQSKNNPKPTEIYNNHIKIADYIMKQTKQLVRNVCNTAACLALFLRFPFCFHYLNTFK